MTHSILSHVLALHSNIDGIDKQILKTIFEYTSSLPTKCKYVTEHNPTPLPRYTYYITNDKELEYLVRSEFRTLMEEFVNMLQLI
eukprot:UN11485